MRRFLCLLVVVLGSLSLAVFASEDPTSIPLPPHPESGQMVMQRPQLIPIEPIPIAGPDVVETTAFASDFCDSAGGLTVLANGAIASDETTVTPFTQDVADPQLSCMAGTSSDRRGYRSAWYKVTAPADGTLFARVATNQDYRRNYDTVLAIHSGACGSLVQLACNDDTYALLSEAAAPVTQGTQYLIEVVDRNLAASGPAILNIEVFLVTAEGWTKTDVTLPEPLSRHAVVFRGRVAYIIGGQTMLGNNPVRSGDVYSYDTGTGVLTKLASMPAAPTVDGQGYSNTGAALVRGKIHMPTGFVGANGNYDGTHWVYDIASNKWEVYSAANGQQDPPWGPPPGNNVPGWAEVVRFDTGSEFGFYVIGGLTGSFFPANPADAKPVKTVYRYVNTGLAELWQRRADLLTARYAHTAARLSDRICVVGGLATQDQNNDGTDDINTLLADGECYFPATDTWQVIGAMNTPRYMAGSAVGPDGRWYVFGGRDATGAHVPTIEYYDFNTTSWVTLSVSHNISQPPLAWPRGGFVDNVLWIFGGEQFGGPVPISLIQSHPMPVGLDALPRKYYLPIMQRSLASGDALTSAISVALNTSRQGSFSKFGEIYHIYAIDVTQVGDVTVSLLGIPINSNYDLAIYDANKNLKLPLGQNLGIANEQIVLQIDEAKDLGRYFIFVIRDAPPPSAAPDPSPYTLVVTQ